MISTAKALGILVGVLLGLTYALRGVSGTIEASLFAIAGYLVVKVFEGELDVVEFLDSRRRK